ncbi:hypothetical protein BS78_04G085400 [Paspalum vaginatum]|nr:hypothetical protein BS78_04G085400 [Paspalum vaginatum]
MICLILILWSLQQTRKNLQGAHMHWLCRFVGLVEWIILISNQLVVAKHKPRATFLWDSYVGSPKRRPSHLQV